MKLNLGFLYYCVFTVPRVNQDQDANFGSGRFRIYHVFFYYLVSQTGDLILETSDVVTVKLEQRRDTEVASGQKVQAAVNTLRTRKTEGAGVDSS